MLMDACPEEEMGICQITGYECPGIDVCRKWLENLIGETET